MAASWAAYTAVGIQAENRGYGQAVLGRNRPNCDRYNPDDGGAFLVRFFGPQTITTATAKTKLTPYPVI